MTQKEWEKLTAESKGKTVIRALSDGKEITIPYSVLEEKVDEAKKLYEKTCAVKEEIDKSLAEIKAFQIKLVNIFKGDK